MWVYYIYIYIDMPYELFEVHGMYHTEPHNIFFTLTCVFCLSFFFFTVTVTLTLFLSSVHPPKPQETQCHRGKVKSHQLNTNYTPAHRA